MKTALSFIVVLVVNLTFFLSSSYAADKKYITFSQPHTLTDKVVIMEIFWYGCPHCYQLEPVIEKWLAEKADYIDFVRMPAVLNRKWLQHAHVYYMAEELGVLEQMHKKLFDAIHVEKRKLMGRINLKAFFEQNGIPNEKFDELYQSTEIKEKVRYAYSVGQQFNLKGVPAIIINGKYGTNASMAGGYEEMISLINKLAEQEYEKLK